MGQRDKQFLVGDEYRETDNQHLASDWRGYLWIEPLKQQTVNVTDLP